MDFYEVLEQVLVLLQRHGRVSYRALKRQFDLNDDVLEDLKEELLYAHPIADDDGRGLLWTGEANAPPEPTASSTRPAQSDVTQEAQPTQVASSPPDPRTPDAERRQLTVMFCDLVGSTPLSEQLDPEDLREVVRAYQQTCAEVVQRFDGHIAQLLGDALLVYFGWPQAHEDDAQRAVRAGLGMLDAMGTLNSRLEQDKGIRLGIRVGIHTGLVVVGAMGGGGHQERLALGETPNIASRLQGLAEPDTVVISEATFRLIEGYFTCQVLGVQVLKGMSRPMPVYRVIGESDARSRLDIVTTRGLTPLVGRESEIALLLERWQQVKDGMGQAVMLSGEAGIGKSRLIQVLKEHISDEPHIRWECRSSPYYRNTALYPITDLFQRTLQWQPEDAPDAKLAKLERNLSQYRLPLEESVTLFAPLLSLPMPEERYPLLNLSPQQQRQKTLQMLLALVLDLAARQPVVFILEDLHWTDPTTLEFLDLLIDQTPAAVICLVLTSRPAFQFPWQARSVITQITLSHLSCQQIKRMAEQVAGGKQLPVDVLHQIVDKTDGVPLFVEELTKNIVESGYLQPAGDHFELLAPLPSLSIPGTLQDSLTARLDRLGAAKLVAQLGSVIGRHFTPEQLELIAPAEAPTLQRELARLVDAELLYQRGIGPQATYVFKHVLIQEAAYSSLLKSTRQAHHQRLAEALESRFPDIVETQPELLAHHYSQAGLAMAAVPYWRRAGLRASARSAYAEGVAHLTAALDLLKTLPETLERAQQELETQIALGPAFVATKGHASPEMERAYARARVLCQQVGQTPQLVQTLWGLTRFYIVRARMRTALEIGEQALALAQRSQESLLLINSHRFMGLLLFHQGDFTSAREHLEHAVGLYNPQHVIIYGQFTANDPGVVCVSRLALTLWLLGYPEQGLAKSRESLTHAEQLSHPFNQVWVFHFLCWQHHYHRDVTMMQRWAEALVDLASEHGFAQFVADGQLMLAWVRVMRDRRKEGIADMRAALEAKQATGALVDRSYQLALLAEACNMFARHEESMDVIDEALAFIEESEERFWEAELHRFRGETLLLLSSSNSPEAENAFRTALKIARRQQAKSLELRGATSLARLWQQQGRRQDAYDLLAPVYGWFTEGFDTADLKDAKALLEDLA